MKQIAILGFGIVGGGIPTVLEQNAEQIRQTVGDSVRVRYVLDLRAFPESPYADRIVHTIDPILADPEVSAVCEAMGGLHPAYEYSLACLEAGKSVVTSNKELVSEKGGELLKCAADHGVHYLFEASVGGGIPLIRPFATSFGGDRITSLCGIVNGTTNYILTAMKRDDRSFEEVLREAQELGYAERDPSADVDGIDAKRKVMILTGLMTGLLPDASDVYTEGIRGVTGDDMNAAERLGGSVRLIARAVTGKCGVSAGVCPMIVVGDNPLSAVNGVYNAVSFTSPMTGDILYYGRGAGRLPTAAAMTADLCAVLSGAADAEKTLVFEKQPAGTLVPFDSIPCDCYVRRESGSSAETAETLSAVSDSAEAFGAPDKPEFIVRGCRAAELKALLPDARILRILR
jgi:homoserine dehydrogenase